VRSPSISSERASWPTPYRRFGPRATASALHVAFPECRYGVHAHRRRGRHSAHYRGVQERANVAGPVDSENGIARFDRSFSPAGSSVRRIEPLGALEAAAVHQERSGRDALAVPALPIPRTLALSEMFRHQLVCGRPRSRCPRSVVRACLAVHGAPYPGLGCLRFMLLTAGSRAMRHRIGKRRHVCHHPRRARAC
jgi:hypothetical protein